MRREAGRGARAALAQQRPVEDRLDGHRRPRLLPTHRGSNPSASLTDPAPPALVWRGCRIALFLRRLGRAGLDAVLPPLCLACGAIVDSPGALCPGCWTRTAWLGPPLCACCGAPFTLAPERQDARCAACLAAPPPFARARAAFRYEGAGRDLVLGFKHADRLHLVPALGAWAARAGAELLAESDLVAPVPLHWDEARPPPLQPGPRWSRARAARLAGRP
jgi:hypothetical protein